MPVLVCLWIHRGGASDLASYRCTKSLFSSAVCSFYLRLPFCGESCLLYHIVLHAVLGVCSPVLFAILGRMWNSILSVPDHCFFV